MMMWYRPILLMSLVSLLTACGEWVLNSPYAPLEDSRQTILYSSFAERPRHLDPAKAYSSNEYAFIGQIYEPPFQYHYLKRPYELEPLTASKMPDIIYFDKQDNQLAADAPAEQVSYSDYIISLKPGILFQPHAAFAKNKQGEFLYHQLSAVELNNIHTLKDFSQTATRELTAEDYVQQIKRLVHPKISSPIAELMKQYIVGLRDFSEAIGEQPLTAIKGININGVEVLDKYRYKIRIHGKYPQFIFWLAMPFFAPMPWEADVFYHQQGLMSKNISLDWLPIGTGAYMLDENNPNLRMVMLKNPNFHADYYPTAGEALDEQRGLLKDAGKALPFIDKAVYRLEKETIPYWSKFLQGYYDASGIASDSFDQAVELTAGSLNLTEPMQQKGIQLQTAVLSSISYMGFNMLDEQVGGKSEQARKLRLAISIAIDYEEYISIFMNGRGVAAQGAIPPEIFGYHNDQQGINHYIYDWHNNTPQRKPLSAAKQLMREAGYANGIDAKTGTALILYLDTAGGGADDRARLNWYRKQFSKLGIQLVIRATDYNRFQQKMREGNAQIFMWGWNADYPDPENFLFLLYGDNAKAVKGGENAANYQNPDFDRLFKKMRNMENGAERLAIIEQMQAMIRHDAPWIFGLHPKSFSLYHSWYRNLKPNLMANNKLKYLRLETKQRTEKRKQWNSAILWPLWVMLIIVILGLLPAIRSFQRRAKETLK